MKKNFIYKEFMRIAAEVVGDNRKAQKFYVMKMCEELGKINYKKPFILWCTRKRCEAYQYNNVQEIPSLKRGVGNYYIFGGGTTAYEIYL